MSHQQSNAVMFFIFRGIYFVCEPLQLGDMMFNVQGEWWDTIYCLLLNTGLWLNHKKAQCKLTMDEASCSKVTDRSGTGPGQTEFQESCSKWIYRKVIKFYTSPGKEKSWNIEWSCGFVSQVMEKYDSSITAMYICTCLCLPFFYHIHLLDESFLNKTVRYIISWQWVWGRTLLLELNMACCHLFDLFENILKKLQLWRNNSRSCEKHGSWMTKTNHF